MRYLQLTGAFCLLLAMNSGAAEAVNETAPSTSISAEQKKIEPEPEPEVELEQEAEAELEPGTGVETEVETGTLPTEILGGTGLKDRKLSEVFEQFIPSESISADNAVPFPVDI